MNTVAKWMMTAALGSVWSLATAQETFNVDFTVGGDTVTGSITTDVSSGALVATDITNYSLTDSLLGVSVNMTADGFTSAPFATTGLVITGNQLEFNFANSTPAASFFGVCCGPSIDLADTAVSAFAGGSMIAVPYVGAIVGPQLAHGALTILGTAPATTAAPEIDPASAAGGLALLVGGLLVLRGRKQQSIAA
jgi:hypothetical protein